MAIEKRQTLSLPLIAFFITIFVTLFNNAYSDDSLSFSFNNFKDNVKNLIFQGDAKTSSDTILLTKTDSNGRPLPSTVGRVLHTAQVRLYDRSTNRLTNFQSQFSFSLKSVDNGPADGLAFFIAPPTTTIPTGSGGGLLGLFEPRNAQNPSANQVVFAEFDTFFAQDSNTWDPNYRHIGINVNSIRSSVVTRWDRREDQLLNVLVTYTAATRTLAVVASYPDGQTYRLSHVVDLRTVLPEWVRVGFSASSGLQVQSHILHSWSFTSTLLYTAEAEKENVDEYLALPRDA